MSEVISFRFVYGPEGKMTQEEMLAHVITQGNYHRGAVGSVLNRVSIYPSGDTFTVFLHRPQL